eukprot:TRINITY_DN2987_c0_g1_i1.p1 TRINITY_DN2987_c0_g1~~TRINITY_DN2987_c0_g1_i1.p1  ORF type:complete len:544 (-),score=113.50 TRINITY_DN2987_c0_g1_i1:274-1815(-)
MWLFFSCLIAVASAAPAGAVVGLTSPLLDLATTELNPHVQSTLDSLTIPDQSFKHHHIHVNLENMKVSDVKCNDCLAVHFVANGGMAASISNLALHFTAYAHAKDGIISTHTTIDADTTVTAALRVIPSLKTATRAENATLSRMDSKSIASDGTLQVEAKSVSVSLSDFSLHFHGGSGWLLNILKGLFQSNVKKSLQSAMVDAITKAVDTDLNNYLSSKMPYVVGLPTHSPLLDVSYHLAQAPSTTATMMSVAIDAMSSPGADCPAGHGAIPPFHPPPISSLPALPGHDDIEIAVAPATLSRAMEVAAACGALDDVVTHKMVDEQNVSSLVALNTSEVSWFASGLWAKYPNHWMAIRIAANASALNGTQPGIQLSDDGSAQTVIPLAFTFEVEVPAGSAAVNRVPVFAVACPLTAGATLNATAVNGSVVLAGQVGELECRLSFMWSSVGEVHYDLLDAVIAGVLNLVVKPSLNKGLGEGILLPLPQVLPVDVDAAHLKISSAGALVSVSVKHS